MMKETKLEYRDLSREVRDILPENENETSIHQSYLAERTIYPDQCWETDPERTTLTQYIARHPFSITPAFAVGDRLRIDGKAYWVYMVQHGHFGITSWTATVTWYYLRAYNKLDIGPPANKWCVMPGKFVDPQPIPTITNAAMFNYKSRPSVEPVDIDLSREYAEARNRYEVVVAELVRVRTELEDKKRRESHGA